MKTPSSAPCRSWAYTASPAGAAAGRRSLAGNGCPAFFFGNWTPGIRRWLDVLLVMLLLIPGGCSSDLTNPYDPDSARPLPLFPWNISVKNSSMRAVTIRFSYAYEAHSHIEIYRNDSLLTKLHGPEKYTDTSGISEDQVFRYRLCAVNPFGRSWSDSYMVNLHRPPRITLTTNVRILDTDTLVLRGTVRDGSGVDEIGVDSIPLMIYPDNVWEYRTTVSGSNDSCVIHARDRSRHRNDTSFTIRPGPVIGPAKLPEAR